MLKIVRKISQVRWCYVIYSLEELKENFNQSLEKVLQESHDQMLKLYQEANIERLYYFLKFSLPRDLGEWLKRGMIRYHSQISNCLLEIIEAEERENDCYACDYHQQMVQRIQTRLSNPPQVIHLELGVNNVFYQGFGAFGLKGGLVYLGLSYIPLHEPWFRIVRWIVALGVGLYYGISTYKKYDAQYRKELLEVGEQFLIDNRKRFQEWFDQIIYFSKEEREICRR